MRRASIKYKDTIRNKRRNRGYFKATIGIVNPEVNKSIEVNDIDPLLYFSDADKMLEGNSTIKEYAMGEKDFSKVDGSMYFTPEYGHYGYYFNGIISENLKGCLRFDFGGKTVSFKGLTVDFSDAYPTAFGIRTNSAVYTYENDNRIWTTEDLFEDVEYIEFVPNTMLHNQNRLRIYSISTGIVNTFTNNELISYSSKEYVSPISQTIPSRDVTIVVDNKSLYYCPDNPDSVIAYMEEGQEVDISFGYETDEDYHTIEWLSSVPCYLKSWSADENKATFVATDRFDYMSTTYKKGLYRANGISLYDLAEDVLEDAGIENYYIDSALNNITVKNPLPICKHTEALQIIANAGRCILYEDSDRVIHIRSSYVPNISIKSARESEESCVDNILGDVEVNYADSSYNYSALDDSRLKFAPADSQYLRKVGYISSSIADANGNFELEPLIIIESDAVFRPNSISFEFANVHPQSVDILCYKDDVKVATMSKTITDNEVTYDDFDFPDCNRFNIFFPKGSPNSRVYLNKITFDTNSDYALRKNTELTNSPVATRQKKLKAIDVTKTLYLTSDVEQEALQTIRLDYKNDYATYEVDLTSASYDLSVSSATEGVTVTLIDSSSYYAKIGIQGATEGQEIEFSILGKVYDVKESNYTKSYNDTGDVITWNNPLIDKDSHADDLAVWLSEYYLGDVNYDIKWRGDPRVEANDLFNLDTVVGTTLVRAYDSTLNFSNAGWSGTMKARKVYRDE